MVVILFLQTQVSPEMTDTLFKAFGIAAVLVMMIYMLGRFLESRVKEQQKTIHDKDKDIIKSKDEQIESLKGDKSALNEAYQKQVEYIRTSNESNLKTLMELSSLMDRLLSDQKDGKVDIIQEVRNTADQIKSTISAEINRISA